MERDNFDKCIVIADIIIAIILVTIIVHIIAYKVFLFL